MERCCEEFSVGAQYGVRCPCCGRPAALCHEGTAYGSLETICGPPDDPEIRIRTDGVITLPSEWSIGVHETTVGNLTISRVGDVVVGRDGFGRTMRVRSVDGGELHTSNATAPTVLFESDPVHFGADGTADIRLEHAPYGGDSLLLAYIDGDVPKWRRAVGVDPFNGAEIESLADTVRIPLAFNDSNSPVVVSLVFSRNGMDSVSRSIRVHPGKQHFRIEPGSSIHVGRDGMARWIGAIETRNVPIPARVGLRLEWGSGNATQQTGVQVGIVGDRTPFELAFPVDQNYLGAQVRLYRDATQVGSFDLTFQYPMRFDLSNLPLVLDFGTSRTVLGMKGNYERSDWDLTTKSWSPPISLGTDLRTIQFESNRWFSQAAVAEADAREGIVPTVFELDAAGVPRFAPGSVSSRRIRHLKASIFQRSISVANFANAIQPFDPVVLLEHGLFDVLSLALTVGIPAALRTEQRELGDEAPWHVASEATREDEVLLGAVYITTPVAWSSSETELVRSAIERGARRISAETYVQVVSDEASLPAMSQRAIASNWEEILVADLGGGTLDVACLRRSRNSPNVIRLIASGGVAAHGGERIAELLFVRLLDLIKGVVSHATAGRVNLVTSEMTHELCRRVARRVMHDADRWRDESSSSLSAFDIQEILSLNVSNSGSGQAQLALLAEALTIRSELAKLCRADFDSSIAQIITELVRVTNAVRDYGRPEKLLLTGAASLFRPFRRAMESVLEVIGPAPGEGIEDANPKLALVEGLASNNWTQLETHGLATPYGCPIQSVGGVRFKYLWAVGDDLSNPWRALVADPNDNAFFAGAQIGVHRLADHAVAIEPNALPKRRAEKYFSLGPEIAQLVLGKKTAWIRFGAKDGKWLLVTAAKSVTEEFLMLHDARLLSEQLPCIHVDGVELRRFT